MSLTSNDIKELMRAYRKNMAMTITDIESILSQDNIIDTICVNVNAWIKAEQLNYRHGNSDPVNRKIVSFINNLLNN